MFRINTIILIGIIDLCVMIAILAYFSSDIIDEQKKLRDNFIKKRKVNLYKLSLSNDVSKQLIKDMNKGFFAKKRDATERLINRSNVAITVEEFYIISIICAVLGWLIGSFLNNTAISIVMAIVVCYAPKTYLNFVCNSIKKQINEQLEPVLSQIIGLLPTKKTLINSCEACIENMEEPLKAYFTEFLNNINNANRSFEESIEELAKKIDTKPFNDFARLAVVHYKQGGDTMYAFNSIPETMRDLKLIQSEQESELDSLRMLGFMFVLLTPASYAFYYLSDKDSFNILTQSTAGKVVSFVVLIVCLITIKLIFAISKPVEI